MFYNMSLSALKNLAHKGFKNDNNKPYGGLSQNLEGARSEVRDLS